MFQAEGNLGDSQVVAGDFRWTSPDGKEEAVLRLQESGKWWHAAHSLRVANAPQSDWWNLASYLQEQHVTVWDMAESLGSWRLEPIFCKDGETPDGVGVVLQCETCRWSSGGPSCPERSSKLRPDVKPGQDVKASVNLGRVAPCYVLRFCPVTGRRILVLRRELWGGSGPQSNESPSAIMCGLGFAKNYRQQRDAPACESPRVRQKEAQTFVASLCAGARQRMPEEALNGQERLAAAGVAIGCRPVVAAGALARETAGLAAPAAFRPAPKLPQGNLSPAQRESAAGATPVQDVKAPPDSLPGGLQHSWKPETLTAATAATAAAAPAAATAGALAAATMEVPHDEDLQDYSLSEVEYELPYGSLDGSY